MVTDPDGYGATTYESTITDHDGVQVHVRVTIPTRVTWDASGERVAAAVIVPQIAQQAATNGMKQIHKAKSEVPF